MAKREYLQQLINGISNDAEDDALITKGIEMSRLITDYLNILGDEERIAAFVGAMRREHRTLQQGFTRLCLAWFEYLATLSENEVDLRNAASRELARHLIASLPGDHRHLPLI